MGRNVHFDAQSGDTPKQVAEKAPELLKHFPNLRREVVVLVAGTNDISQWMRQEKSTGGWEASYRERLVKNYV